tara:strand:- start:160 stop:681 length:522 start_codon:yes stop_codon:yes gene_type:complete
MEPHPFLVEWIEENQHTGRALVVGSGLGEDAAFLCEKGWEVTAFDISESAIEWASQLHKGKEIDWSVGDLVKPEESWKGAFDLVLEVHILQAIPEKIRNAAYTNLSSFLERHGLLVCIGRLADGLEEEIEVPPWPLSREFIHQIGKGLSEVEFHTAVIPDKEEIRYRAVWKRD